MNATRVSHKAKSSKASFHYFGVSWNDALLALLIALTFTGYSLYSFLSVWMGVDASASRTITIPYRAVVLAISLLLWSRAYLMHQIIASWRTHKLFFAVWGLYTIRLIYDTCFRPAELSRPAYEYWAYAMGVSLFSFLGMLQPLSALVSRLAIRLMWVMLFIACLLGLTTQSAAIVLSEGRVEGNSILNTVSYGQAGVSFILVSTYLMLETQKTSVLITLALCTIPAFWTVAASASRSPPICLVIGMAVWALHAWRCGRLRMAGAGILIFVVILVKAVSVLMSQGSTLTSRFVETYETYNANSSELERFEVWEQTWDEYWSNPIFGAGIELSSGTHPHNLFLEAFLATGLLGGCLYIWLQFSALRDCFSLAGSKEFGWLPLMFAQWFVLSQFSGHFRGSMELWAIMLLQATVLAQRHMHHTPVARQLTIDSPPAASSF